MNVVVVLQYGYKCFCGDTFGRYKHIDTNVDFNAACTTSCSGDSSKHCGGPLLNTIYYVNGSRSQLLTTAICDNV